MNEVAKTPQLQCRANGVFYYRARLPGDVLRAINGNKREWKRRTSTRGAPLVTWSKLVGKNGEPKKELWYSLETRDISAAKRALPSKQVEINSLFEQIIRLLAGEQNTPTMRDVEKLAAKWFAERDESRRLANLTPADDEDTESLLREDLAQSQSQRLEDLGSYQKIAEALLFKEGFAADWSTSPVRFLVQLIQRGRIELCQRALGEYLGSYGKTYDDIFEVFNVDVSRPRTPSSADYTLKELISDFMQDRSASINSKSVTSYETAFRVAKDVLGEGAIVRDISREQCRQYVNILKQFPSNYKKHRALKGLDTVAASQRAKEIGLKPISVSTANGYLSRFVTLLKWAVVEDKLHKNPALNLSAGTELLAKEDRRLPFTIQELQKIFGAPLFTGCVDDENNYNRPKVGNCPRRSRFWAQLIAIFTGCRLNEILQMRVDDIQERDSVNLFVVRLVDDGGQRAPDKKVKTSSSRRIVPVHPELIRIGFLKYVESQRVAGANRLFPEVNVGSDGYYSSPYSKWHNHFLTSVEVKSERKSFHSFRHNFRDAMREADLSQGISEALGGWVSRSVSSNYGSGFSPKALEVAMNKIRYEGLDLSHLHVEL
ncbi:MAG: hypothetical protein JNK83_08105 [Rhizobiales bacterium]|nr:hypothetical protein [Hyphomicrobiales bacterium]